MQQKREVCPGVSAVTHREQKEPPEPRREQIIPVVRYAVECMIATGKPDYWDYAALLELAFVTNDERKAQDALGNAFSMVRKIGA